MHNSIFSHKFKTQRKAKRYAESRLLHLYRVLAGCIQIAYTAVLPLKLSTNEGEKFMQHGPAVELGRDLSIPKKTRLGVVFFIIYLAIYTGFVVIGSLFTDSLSVRVFAGLNLAVVYGMALIILAAVLGLFYNHYCTKYEKQMNQEDK
jgi:uncharacterized membrane protein (DUF485 family)